MINATEVMIAAIRAGDQQRFVDCLEEASAVEIVDALEATESESMDTTYLIWTNLDTLPGGKVWSVFREEVNRMSLPELVQLVQDWTSRDRSPKPPAGSDRQAYLDWMDQCIWD